MLSAQHSPIGGPWLEAGGRRGIEPKGPILCGMVAPSGSILERIVSGWGSTPAGRGRHACLTGAGAGLRFWPVEVDGRLAVSASILAGRALRTTAGR